MRAPYKDQLARFALGMGCGLFIAHAVTRHDWTWLPMIALSLLIGVIGPHFASASFGPERTHPYSPLLTVAHRRLRWRDREDAIARLDEIATARGTTRSGAVEQMIRRARLGTADGH